MFYSKHHGTDLLSVAAEGIPRYEQPYGMGALAAPRTAVAYIDVLATASDETVFVHAINRSFGDDYGVRLDLSGFPDVGPVAVHHTFVGRLHDQPAAGEPREVGRFEAKQVAVADKALNVTLPKRSASIIEIPCRR